MPLPVQHSPLLRRGQFYYKPENKTFTLTLQSCIFMNCKHAQSHNFSVQFIYEVLCHVRVISGVQFLITQFKQLCLQEYNNVLIDRVVTKVLKKLYENLLE